MKMYVKANKPFYGVIIYKDTAGNLVQLLPNPHRTENYFLGGIVYEVPGGGDCYDLQICAPFGTESVTLYASTMPLGALNIAPDGGIYKVETAFEDVGARTRSIQFVSKKGNASTGSKAEFTEATITVTTTGN